jgi:CAAX protease family protein
MPSALDLVYVAFVALAWPLYAHFVDWPRFQRRLRDEPSRARTPEYRETLFTQWAIVAAGAVLFASRGRPWAALGVQAPHGWRVGPAAAILATFAILYALQAGTAGRSPGARAKLRKAFGSLEALLPHTHAELAWFLAVSVTAGVCEEFFFRGYFIYALAPALGWWGAAVLGAPVFGLLHAYQGRAGIARTAIVGVVMAGMVALTGSLVVAMALHALIDIGGGSIGWIALRDGVASDDAAPLSEETGIRARSEAMPA